MPNALANESSPYLRQHANNPVDWLPWGPVALAAARERDVPLLVSIGYSSCHWCHVMERECFEDERIAQLMNERFVCVKVDREERPDVDALYMEAVQAMTGHGGWPLNVFLTPEGVPFYGGTYFPPQERPGMASFPQVLLAVAEAWAERGEEIRAGGERLREQLAGGARLAPAEGAFDESALETAVDGLKGTFDAVHGGFGGAPKFPPVSVLELLMARGEREMALYTLRSMAGGGIHDQIGGGFHRYAVDTTWTVPHFEKMLYDNALLARAYLHGFQLSGDRQLLEVCHDTLDWALREMRGPEGGFYSALDADSDGAEGRFYVWSVEQLEQALGEDAEAAIRWLGASEQGNFRDPHNPEPGLNVLEDRGPRPEQATRARIRKHLLDVREQRTWPGLDDKRITSWNALMIAALAEAGGGYLDAAIGCAEFLLRDMRDEQGRLFRSYNDGQAKIGAYLEDYAFLLEALIALFEATCEERWLTEATVLADQLIERFSDPENGGFFSTAADGEELIVRRKELEDSPIPAGGSSAAMGLLRLAQLTGNAEYEHQSTGAVALLQTIAPRHPTAFGHMLQAMHWTLAPPRPIACELPTK
ncbi:MAG TPA: thioredoxin domain-containing protein [Solirubrobacteraceae bacterium]|nr:thioredoxin domain-containing protein [Solirubrobacteraceae bacterium]